MPMQYACAECADEIEPGDEVNDFGLVFCSEACRDSYAAEYEGE